jgi:predicted glycogen debranching enzyme
MKNPHGSSTVQAVRGDSEWLETDGRGGFASGTARLVRTRRYHALLLSAANPPADRFVLVNGLEAWVETARGRFAISSQRYAGGDGGGVLYPDGLERLTDFRPDPWPRWTFRLEDGTEVEQEIFVAREGGATSISWRAQAVGSGVALEVRLLMSGRDYHALHHENSSFAFEPEEREGARVWRPYDGVPGIAVSGNGAYRHDPSWYRGFLYSEERARGLDFTEDLASPGVFRFDLSAGEAVLHLCAELPLRRSHRATSLTPTLSRREKEKERERRARFSSRLQRAGDDYLVARGGGKTVVAGYPWFTDWGRDTFISLRGLCLSTGRLSDAGEILGSWAGAVSEGMLPNRYADRGEEPEFNSVDASLWYVVAVHEYLQKCRKVERPIPDARRARLLRAMDQILEGYSAGTRFGIRADADGLLAAGAEGVQLTWMDAKVGDQVITPRIGKPVEVQALWINALTIASMHADRWAQAARRAGDAFASRFWNRETGTLYDVVDPDHRRGTADASFRPNQIFAVGGLPYAVLPIDRGRSVVDAVEKSLWTPRGLRTLAPEDPRYRGRYEGGVEERDGAYHQGTVWPWLAGPFVEAWVRVRGDSPDVRREARARFLEPLLFGMGEAGLGHLPEIADGDAPHAPRGCPFQAWSVAEALRLDLDVLAVSDGDSSGPG